MGIDQTSQIATLLSAKERRMWSAPLSELSIQPIYQYAFTSFSFERVTYKLQLSRASYSNCFSDSQSSAGTTTMYNVCGY
jgi:hypothetical protein